METLIKEIEKQIPVSETNMRMLASREVIYALMAMDKNEKLSKCPLKEIATAIINVVKTGLTLNPIMREAYLIPKKGVCKLEPSYMGLSKILMSDGSVKNFTAELHWEGDDFTEEKGTSPRIKHIPYYINGKAKGKLRGAYSVAVLEGGIVSHNYMTREELSVIMGRSEAYKNNAKASTWFTDFGEMCKKTVMKRHWKTLPKGERAEMAAQIIDFDNQVNGIDFTKEKEDIVNEIFEK